MDWLPALFLLADHNGNWTTYLDALYEQFRIDFVHTSPTFRGSRLGLKRHPLTNGREATFWHFISEGKIEEFRNFDELRCERIGWPRPIIDQATEQRLPVWWEERRGERRIVIALPDFSYMVVLAERNTPNGIMYLPWTAYHVLEGHRRKRNMRIWATNRL